jgi:hypothetical protein
MGASALRFLLILLFLALSVSVIFRISVRAFAVAMETRSPESFETPLSGLAPLVAAAFTTIVIHIAVLGYLTYRRVRFAEFFMVMFILFSIQAVGPDFIIAPLALKYFRESCPMRFACSFSECRSEHSLQSPNDWADYNYALKQLSECRRSLDALELEHKIDLNFSLDNQSCRCSLLQAIEELEIMLGAYREGARSTPNRMATGVNLQGIWRRGS